jgi:hypothetical protein
MSKSFSWQPKSRGIFVCSDCRLSTGAIIGSLLPSGSRGHLLRWVLRQCWVLGVALGIAEAEAGCRELVVCKVVQQR